MKSNKNISYINILTFLDEYDIYLVMSSVLGSAPKSLILD